ncbi:MAG: CBS domain-containing protein, partial [Ardenticatenales bacterium]|nr:CBS domain-containing protein [Ardenticatenales bacterium]
IMVPRTRMVTTSIDTPVVEVLRLAADSAYTRIPIYEKDIDHIIGFVHLKDLFRLHYQGNEEGLRSILRQVPYVPETMPAVDVWETLNGDQSYIALVFDEYGGTAGMISQEDLIEELFGELQDEFDQEADLIAPAGDSRIVVRGDMLITQMNDLLQLRLPNEIANTVGGLVLDQLGRPPVVGDEVEIEQIRFQVLAVVGRSVREISLTLPPDRATMLEETP